MKLAWEEAPQFLVLCIQPTNSKSKITNTFIRINSTTSSKRTRDLIWGDGRKASQWGSNGSSEPKVEAILRHRCLVLFLQTISGLVVGRAPVVGMAHYWAHHSLPEPQQGSSHLQKISRSLFPDQAGGSTEAINRRLRGGGGVIN